MAPHATTAADYAREWRRRNPEKAKAIQSRYRQQSGFREKVNAYRRNSASQKEKRRVEAYNKRRQLRLVAISALGGQCCRCGFDDERALEFDHKTPILIPIRGWNFLSSQLKAVVKGDPHDIQLLCANCHAIKTKTEDQNLFRKRSI